MSVVSTQPPTTSSATSGGRPAVREGAGAATLELAGPVRPEYAAVLTPAALQFVADLAAEFEPRRQALLARRQQRQAELDAGVLPEFLAETRAIREGDWTAAPIVPDLRCRRVE